MISVRLPRRLTPALMLAAAFSLPLAAEAHRAWILPAATSLSSDDAWVTFDAAISNDIFHPDYHAMSAAGITATAPDGSEAPLENIHTGKHRSNFDLNLTQRGTYRISSAGKFVIASWEENGERKRWRGDASQWRAAVPADAADLRITESARRLETYVTAGAPTETVFKPGNNGLELVPVTHPNDLFAGEEATFQLLIDGKPAAALTVEVIAGGMRYRNQQDEMTTTTDQQGRFSVTWPAAGMYWLNAELEDDQASIPNATRRASFTGTFEVLPQ
ncbi:DUF4198 domain-containing protein [Alcanivorax quisquiliarum]|uniref:DUF4198 domain-containing protein n=1 Tax=Alcanivorax quisquiliarum TaxID=2933565 RepID=A0ABT0E974_9GAMM|nr:DUF4198 domain-containing protein [Alcanivorax quisquiliarum]MCK0538293.1 DUF4198 domain-containing protein [Alcanivorax quisquiliarum]